MARTKKYLSRVIMAVLLIAPMLVTNSFSKAYAAEMEFAYDSLLVGFYNNSAMTDKEWREYYTDQFDTVYSDVYISFKPYDWYATQKGTKCSKVDCGVACMSMALKWYDKSMDKPVNTIRDELGYYDRGITNIEMDTYLTKYGVPHKIQSIGTDSMKEALKNDDIVLTILKASNNKYHAVIFNGTYQYDGKLYFTYYNPEGNTKKYDLEDIDYEVYMVNYQYSIISDEDLNNQLYSEWAAVIQPKKG